jgi:O-antigen ligase
MKEMGIQAGGSGANKSIDRVSWPTVGATALACAAVALPTVLAVNFPPSATFLNQAVAMIGWGAFLCFVAAQARSMRPRGGLGALLVALAVLALAAVASFLVSLPGALALSSIGMLAAAAIAALGGAAAAQSHRGLSAFRAVCIALLVAGVLGTFIGIVQVFFPAWADGQWIAAATIEGRASGNLRQPNHLSSLLLWSVIAAVWLAQAGHLGRRIAAVLAALFVFGLVLTASRTGIVGVVILALWGVMDRRLSRSTRAVLMATPLVYLLFWLGLSAWAQFGGHAFGGDTHLTDTSETPNSRMNIWADTLSMIVHQPWLGVGFGEFNFAWSLTPFQHRPTAFFDHTHNLVLQFAVELGLPLATLVLALLAFALWRAFVAGRDAPEPQGTMLRAAFMVVLMMVVHSQLEYPLWYAYFLLPTAFAFGLCLGADTPASGTTNPVGQRASWLVAGSALLLVGGVLSVLDYWRVVVIFSPPEGASSLQRRIAEGERSWLFAHHAHYAAATMAEHPSQAMPSFKVATHYLLDTRLMMAWATALHEAGDDERARFIAQRLREFRNEASVPFFAPCDAAPQAGVALPFQCTAPTKSFGFRDFR